MKKNPYLLLFSLCLIPNLVLGFCGFYVAKADATLFNKASQVVVVRDEKRTAITMYSDYKGEMSDFAIVVPVPEILTREQINVGDRSLIEHIDNFTAPRLVEYFDPDPCAPIGHWDNQVRSAAPMMKAGAFDSGAGGAALGVKIEAQYTVGEYDILILSAKESSGLETWLVQNGYKMPKGSQKALAPYIKQQMKFFVAKVNLKEQAKSGFTYLRPLQFAFESPKFMLPLRLGMVNADGPQDMLMYFITKKGRVETTNYRTVKLPSDQEIPTYTKTKFADFYRAMFETSHKKENQKVVFLEYAWNTGWCDPCAADPLSNEELRKLGVFWLNDTGVGGFSKPGGGFRGGMNAQAPFVTRFHVRYDADHFPEDLMFQETSDSSNFQGRYVLRHPWTGAVACDAGKKYPESVRDRREKEARTLASLTGWNIGDIRKEMGPYDTLPADPDKKWYQGIFR